MTGPRPTRSLEPKPVHLIMRDNTMLEGEIHIAEEQPLVSYLASRKGGWMNMVNARRPKYGDLPGHMIVQSDHIVMASCPTGNIQIVIPVTGGFDRLVDIVLPGGTTVRGHLPLAPQQRMSDYVNTAGKFIGIGRARLLADGRELGDVAIHTAAIAMLREAPSGAPALPGEGR